MGDRGNDSDYFSLFLKPQINDITNKALLSLTMIRSSRQKIEFCQHLKYEFFFLAESFSLIDSL
jgi:hypothetical protein